MSYQRIKIGSVDIPGVDRSREYEWIFKSPPRGKTILDLGCNIGYYIIRAVNEGAKYCTGIERARKYATTANEVIEALGFKNIEVLKGNFWSFFPCKQYDIVLCLSVLHHLENMSVVDRLLEKIDQWSKERMVFVLTLPDNPDLLYFEGLNRRGRILTDISPKYLVKKYPEYTVKWTTAPSYKRVMAPNRAIVEVIK